MGESRKSIPLYQKAAGILWVLFVWSLITIALDQHYYIYSDTCPICHAKNDINGTVNSFELNAYLVRVHYYLTEKLFDVTSPITLFCQGRAPPELFQS
jgi:hypothetical protein